MTHPTAVIPVSLRIARFVAGTQAVLASICMVLSALYAVSGYSSWANAQPNSFDGIVFGFAVAVLVPSVVVVATVGIPTLRLDRPSPVSALVLLIGETLIVAANLMMESTYTLLSADHLVPTLTWLAIMASVAIVYIGVLNPTARRWLGIGVVG